MKMTLAVAALALATGCVCANNRNDVAPTAAEAEPRFADHEGRPSGHHAAHSGSASDDDDPWWSSVLGDFIAGFFSLLFSKDPVDASDDRPDDFKPWPVDTGNL